MQTKNGLRIILSALALLVIGGVIFNNFKGSNTLPVQGGLPEKVEAKRQAIYAAAKSEDYDKLAAEAGTPFNYSFGGEYEGGFVGYLKLAAENEGRSAFDILPTLLQMPYVLRGSTYTWPSVFVKTANEWTDEDIAQMKKIMTDEQIEEYRKFGSYAYYRLGISEEGNWAYYLAGD